MSLFANCGAGDTGYARAGFRFEVLAELERRRLDVASLNHPRAACVVGDLRQTWPEVVERYRARRGDQPPALLAACPPCQGMSTARSDRGKAEDADAGSRDTRNLLVEVVAQVAIALQPRVVVIENVAAFLTRKVRHPDNGRPIAAARLLVDRLAGPYAPFAINTDLADFGVPQSRRRAFVVLVRQDEPGLRKLTEEGRVPFPAATHGPGSPERHVTLQAALRELGAGWLDASSEHLAGKGLHRVPVWEDRRYAMVAGIPPGGGSSAWQNTDCPECGTVKVGDEDASCPLCRGPLTRPVVREEGGWRLIAGFRNSSYRRMRGDRPAAAVTTASGRIGSDNTLHPIENRVLSMLECQHLQTFPADFQWGQHLARHGHTSLRQMIGEAVPPRFTEAHGRVLASLLEGRLPRRSMQARDRRALAAAAKLGLGGDHAAATQLSLTEAPAPSLATCNSPAGLEPRVDGPVASTSGTSSP